jgi:hypothetical protein
MRVSQVVKGEMSAKTTYQRSAKGPLSISECSADGKFIALENTGRKVPYEIIIFPRHVSNTPYSLCACSPVRSEMHLVIWMMTMCTHAEFLLIMVARDQRAATVKFLLCFSHLLLFQFEFCRQLIVSNALEYGDKI